MNRQGTWHPSAPIKTARARAKLLADIRTFFSARNILEVDTPLLSHSTTTEPTLHSFTTRYRNDPMYLQTSPEFAMKRLIAAGYGDSYQICKAFRDNESGRHHNPEFTMLEWYRMGDTHLTLMDEVDDFLQTILHTKPATRITYQAAFQKYLHLDPHTCTIDALQACAAQKNLKEIPGIDPNHKDDWLDLLLTHCIEPHLGQDHPEFIYDYPASQAALAKIREDTPPVAERFEVYIKGIELANGFHELTHADIQSQRFIDDLQKRHAQKLAELPIDQHFITALAQGMPDCAGVALGIDRLLMLAVNAGTIDDVLAFAVQSA